MCFLLRYVVWVKLKLLAYQRVRLLRDNSVICYRRWQPWCCSGYAGKCIWVWLWYCERCHEILTDWWEYLSGGGDIGWAYTRPSWFACPWMWWHLTWLWQVIAFTGKYSSYISDWFNELGLLIRKSYERVSLQMLLVCNPTLKLMFRVLD